MQKTTLNKKTVFLLFVFTLFFNSVNCQTFKKQFNDLVSKKDTVKQQQLLEKWKNEEGNDPELFVAYFNYYVNKSKQEMITLGQDPQGKDALQIMDQDKTKKEPVAYLYENTSYDSNLLKKGFDWITNGITKHPNRLDMRFGKIYMLGELEDYENFTTEIIQTIDYSNTIKNEWTWTDNKPVENPQDFMLSSIQGYQLQLYSTENDDLLDNMKRIAETVLKYYPDHIESLSNCAVVFLIQKQYDQALVALLKAEKINPTDLIILNNIAQAYKLKGNSNDAIKYYELIIKHGDQNDKEYAQEQINQLKKK